LDEKCNQRLVQSQFKKWTSAHDAKINAKELQTLIDYIAQIPKSAEASRKEVEHLEVSLGMCNEDQYR
jgi:hypothetical protein